MCSYLCLFLGSENPTSKAMYKETNRKVEKLSEYISLIQFKIYPVIVVLPKFISCVVISLTTDSKSDAYELPFPMW